MEREAERERADEERSRMCQVRALEIGQLLERLEPGYLAHDFVKRQMWQLELAEQLPTERSENVILRAYKKLTKH